MKNGGAVISAVSPGCYFLPLPREQTAETFAV